MLSVLIVDDSSTIRKMLTFLLSDMNFNVVATASSGEEGIQLYNEHKPHFVTMDVNMVGMSGIEALKKIRYNHKDANVFMLTSRGDDKVVMDSIKYGAKGYILKPLVKEKIEKAIIGVFPNAFKNSEEKQEDNSSVQNYESSIKDPLTSLYTVQYMHHTIQHLIEMHDRNDDFIVGLLIVNIANLDEITTNFGAMQKEIILTQAADEIQDTIRPTDFPIRLTNNEFAIFVLGNATNDMDIIAKRLKQSIEKIKNQAAIGDTLLEVSIGMALHKKEEKLIAFLERTDEAVAEATNNTKSGIFMS